MQRIYENLYQFSAYIPPMDFSIHQYLLAADPAIVFATGTRAQAEQNLPQIRAILGERPVKYIFVSHLESDECGGLPVFLRAYPQATALCYAWRARAFRLWLRRERSFLSWRGSSGRWGITPALFRLSRRDAFAKRPGVF